MTSLLDGLDQDTCREHGPYRLHHRDVAVDMGHEVRLFVSCGENLLRVRITQPSVEVREGATVYLKINMEKMFLFRKDTGERIILDEP